MCRNLLHIQDQQSDDDVQQEWAEVKQLQQQQLADRIGLPGLRIEQSYGEQAPKEVQYNHFIFCKDPVKALMVGKDGQV